ncbi:uncharacterized protein LOC123881249 [Maniola jurtina]|uniref:uncharacterized protein LOC123881249 n=1 Tax=Maniola jurtina TaxID=191418 RepID=UPI001E68F223|nr:uncharacterized protein LOC123881249 [Maniola jurtina]
MSFRWSEDTTLKFVSLYIQHECLWNFKSPQYKNKHIKQSAYLDLENKMNVPGFGEKEIKLKIKNIRSTYSQELKKIKDSKKSGAGTDTVYIPSVKWFSLLDASLRNLTSTLTHSESNLASDSLHTDETTDTEQNSTVVDTFREPTPPPPPPLPPPPPPQTKKRKIAQLSSMVRQLKEIADTSNSTVEENEFEVFGKHVGLQLKSLPLLLALEAQEHIQIYINRIRRQHLQTASEQNGITTPQSYATESPYSDSSTYYNDTSNYNLEEQATECFSSSILPTDNSEHVSDYQLSSNMFPSGHVNQNETQSVTIISNDLILTAMQNANVNK